MADSTGTIEYSASPSTRIRREMKTIQEMIRLYCRARHQKAPGLCDECELLQQYALKRLQKCPFQQNKTTCSNCAVHCYSAKMKSRIIEVMRFSGPRMLLHHPFLAVAHLLDEKVKDANPAEKHLAAKKTGTKKR